MRIRKKQKNKKIQLAKQKSKQGENKIINYQNPEPDSLLIHKLKVYSISFNYLTMNHGTILIAGRAIFG